MQRFSAFRCTVAACNLPTDICRPNENSAQNYVGYAQNDLLLSGGTLTAPMFQTVGATDHSIKLGEIIPVLENGNVADPGGVNLQYLNYFGGTDDEHNYVWMGTYWFSMFSSGDASEEDVPAGQSFFVNNNSGGSTPVALRSSGEVNQKDVIFPLLLSGGSCCANPFPTATTFGQIIPMLGDEKGSKLADPGNVNLQYLNYFGGTDDTHNYVWMGTYWYNMYTFSDATEEIVPAGQGFFVNNNSGGSTPVWLYVPAPEL